MERQVPMISLEQRLETYHFEMFSTKGNDACRTLVKKVFRRIKGKYRLTKSDIVEYCSAEMKKIEKKFPEVYDTEPLGHIVDLINQMCFKMDYTHEIKRWDF
jgi:hypothetical protein